MEVMSTVISRALFVSGQFRASNSKHSSCDVCFSCIPILFVDFYLLIASKYSM